MDTLMRQVDEERWIRRSRRSWIVHDWGRIGPDLSSTGQGTRYNLRRKDHSWEDLGLEIISFRYQRCLPHPVFGNFARMLICTLFILEYWSALFNNIHSHLFYFSTNHPAPPIIVALTAQLAMWTELPLLSSSFLPGTCQGVIRWNRMMHVA